jgi:hypothetical protein
MMTNNDKGTCEGINCLACDGEGCVEEPPPGSWADVARMMHEIDPDFDWDAWKDEMKDRDL